MEKRLILKALMSLMMNNISTSESISSKTSKGFDLKEKINEIPDKLGFKIGEVAKFVGVKSYVLRYWESEFESLSPKKSQNGQRFYTRKDIEMALTIRKLLYEDRFSIEGAKSALKKMKSMARSSSAKETLEMVQETTEAEILQRHKPAAEIVLNKAQAQMRVDQAAKKQELHQKLHIKQSQSSVNTYSQAHPSPTQEALQSREKEITQFWVSSIDYLVEEIRQARKRLAV